MKDGKLAVKLSKPEIKKLNDIREFCKILAELRPKPAKDLRVAATAVLVDAGAEPPQMVSEDEVNGADDESTRPTGNS
jgi:hypothetical protein